MPNVFLPAPVAPPRVVSGLFLAVLILAAFLGANSARAGLLDHDLTVVTVTDVTDAGKRIGAATKDKPIYYEACSLGYQDVGRSRAGHALPAKNKMIRRIIKTLAEQGYVLATRENPPTQFLVFFWGSMNNYGSALKFMGGDRLNLMWELENTPQNHNPNILLRRVRSGEAVTIMDSAQGELFVAQVQAFDQKKLRDGTTELLWSTKISCPTTGLAMDTSLDQMVVMAGPHFGRETVRPVMASAADRKEVIELGDLVTLDDSSPLPVYEWNAQAQVMEGPSTAAPVPAAKP